MRTLIVTGASGYIGRHLVAQGRAAGWRVVAATRKPIPGADDWICYRLEENLEADAFPRDSVIVHLAAQTAASIDANLERAAADRLVDVAQKNRSRLVFVSSQTARPDAPTLYGRTKWAIEQRILAGGGIIVRPGLVYGGSPGGVYAALLRLLRKHTVLPSFRPRPRVQPVHVEDLAQALLLASEPAVPSGRVLRIAASEPVAFDAFLRALATSRGYSQPRFLPLPVSSVALAAAALAAAGMATLATRIQSLTDLPQMEVDDLRARGLALRSLEEGLARTRPHRRALAAEARVMTRYVLGRPAPLGIVRRYVRCIEGLRTGRSLELPPLVRAWPPALRALDQRHWLRRWPELDWRIRAAAAITEASTDGAQRYLAFDPIPRHRAFARLTGIVALEALARIGGWPLRAIAQPPIDG